MFSFDQEIFTELIDEVKTFEGIIPIESSIITSPYNEATEYTILPGSLNMTSASMINYNMIQHSKILYWCKFTFTQVFKDAKQCFFVLNHQWM